MWEAEFKRSSYLQVMSGDTRRLCEVLGQHVLLGPQLAPSFVTADWEPSSGHGCV